MDDCAYSALPDNFKVSCKPKLPVIKGQFYIMNSGSVYDWDLNYRGSGQLIGGKICCDITAPPPANMEEEKEMIRCSITNPN